MILVAEKEAQELDDILSTPQGLSQKQLKLAHLKRRSHADVKLTELNDYVVHK